MKLRRALVSLVLLLCGSSLACAQDTDPNAGLIKDGGGGTDDGTDAPVGTDGCGKWAAAFCARLEECASSLSTSRFGGAARCAPRLANGCRDALAAPGTGESDARLETCAADLSRVVCVEILARNLTLFADHPWNGLCGTTPKGKGDMGASCFDDAQCAAGWCKPKDGSKCGTCTDFIGEGASCTSDIDCGPRLVCKKSLCAPVGIIGSSCDDGHPCALDLACVSKSCVETVSKEGSACDPTTKPCDAARGLVCGASKSCEKSAPPAPLEDAAPCLSGGVCISPARCYAGTCKLLTAADCR